VHDANVAATIFVETRFREYGTEYSGTYLGIYKGGPFYPSLSRPFPLFPSLCSLLYSLPMTLSFEVTSLNPGGTL